MKKKSIKNIVIFIVVFLFTSYISLILVVSNRNYLFIEKIFKNINSYFNSIIINNMYDVKKISANVIDTKTKLLQEENNTLKELVDLKTNNKNIIVSEVTNHVSKNWFNSIYISNGTSSNINKNDAVINSDGVIGFVSKTTNSISEVDLITNVSSNNMISVLIDDEAFISGMISDYDEKEKLFVVTDVMYNDMSLTNKDVFLSGFIKSSHKGLYVGKVVKEEVSNYGLNKTLWVKSNVNFDDLLYVLVIGE